MFPRMEWLKEMMEYEHPSLKDETVKHNNVYAWTERLDGWGGDFIYKATIGFAVRLNGNIILYGFSAKVDPVLLDDQERKDIAVHSLYQQFLDWSKTQTDDPATWTDPHN